MPEPIAKPSYVLPPKLKRFVEHMPFGDDLTLLVLKGHLLIEEKLQEIVEASVIHPAALEKARLSFAQRLCLARALDDDHEPQQGMYLLMEKLNTLRNQLVHNLDHDDLEKRVADFVGLYLSELKNVDARKQDQTIPIPDQLRSCVAFLLGFLIQFLANAKAKAYVISRMRDAERQMRDDILRSNGEDSR